MKKTEILEFEFFKKLYRKINPKFRLWVRKVEKVLPYSLFYLAAKGTKVYLIIDPNADSETKSIKAISVDEEFLTEERVKEAKEAGHKIVIVKELK